MEKVEKKYVRHLNDGSDGELLDDLMKQDIKKMDSAGWNMRAVVATQDRDEAPAIVVTFERKKA
jgi:hypothetical protein